MNDNERKRQKEKDGNYQIKKESVPETKGEKLKERDIHREREGGV